MSEKRIPNYIKRDMHYNPRDILTAQEYNAILNLLISQGDYNSSWLEYLQNDAIPDAIKDLSVEQITEFVTVAVQQELAALSASITSKTSRQLNNPMVTILNTAIGYTGIDALNTLLLNKSLKATYAIATNLVDSNAAYPTLAQLISLKAQGNDIVAYSTDGATITTDTVNTVVPVAYQYMDTNEFDADVFVYPHGNSDITVRDTVCNIFKYAVNILNDSVIIPDGILNNSGADVHGNLSVIKLDNTVSLEDIEAIIDDIVQYNKYMILWIDTDSANYSAELLENVLDYMLTKAGIIYPDSISTAISIIHNTIGNLLQGLSQELDGLYVTEIDSEKYLNW